jgi:hypothetical protein
LIEQHGFPPEKISAVGYSEFRPYVPNNTIENRALNRRVDVVVLTMELSAIEPASDLNDFAQTEMNALHGLIEGIDSLRQTE